MIQLAKHEPQAVIQFLLDEAGMRSLNGTDNRQCPAMSPDKATLAKNLSPQQTLPMASSTTDKTSTSMFLERWAEIDSFGKQKQTEHSLAQQTLEHNTTVTSASSSQTATVPPAYANVALPSGTTLDSFLENTSVAPGDNALNDRSVTGAGCNDTEPDSATAGLQQVLSH